MAKLFGTVTPSGGTGNKAINLGVSGITRLSAWASYVATGYVAESFGRYVSGVQKQKSTVEGYGSTAPATGFIELLNNAGTVVYQATVTSIVGSTLNLNVTVATITPTILLDGDDY